jgi:hypothetical protein
VPRGAIATANIVVPVQNPPSQSAKPVLDRCWIVVGPLLNRVYNKMRFFCPKMTIMREFSPFQIAAVRLLRSKTFVFQRFCSAPTFVAMYDRPKIHALSHFWGRMNHDSRNYGKNSRNFRNFLQGVYLLRFMPP